LAQLLNFSLGILNPQISRNEKSDTYRIDAFLLCLELWSGQSRILKDALKPHEIKITGNDTATHFWRYTGFIGVNFGQVALVNWAGWWSELDSIQANANGTLTYEKKRFLWDNQLNFSLGGIAQGRIPPAEL
jgi:hypothetical protein